VFDFTLNDDEIAGIDALNADVRLGPSPDDVDPSTWGLEIPEA
jgi:hypothetical protein